MNIKAQFSSGIKAIAMQGAEAAPIKGVIHAASAIRAELSEEEGIRAEMKTGGYVKGLDGKSAYQIAVENGFEGTEEEWLASLKGEPGQADAEQVEQIITDYLEKNPIEGVTPEQVAQAVESALQQAKESGEFDGPQGPKGDKGEPGPQGPAGSPGKDGNPGKDGISPTVLVQDISGGHRVTITDKDGEKTFDVMDGKDGTGGGASVQADWAVNDESDPAFVKNRTHYEYQAFDIRWDGDKTGKFALDMSMLGYSQGMYFVKVSDSVLSAEKVIGATAENVGFDSFTVTENMIDMASFPGAMSVNNNVISVQDQSMLNAALGTPDGYITNGTYFFMHEAYGYYVARFVAKTDVVKIPERFLPESQAGKPDWNENDPNSTAYVQNRTHWVEKGFEPIIWDGNTEGRDVVDLTVLGIGPVYKISDKLLTVEELANSETITDYKFDTYSNSILSAIEGAELGIGLPSGFMVFADYGTMRPTEDGDEDFARGMLFTFFEAGDFTSTFGVTIPSTGLYCIQTERVPHILTVQGKEIYHKIDKRYIPLLMLGHEVKNTFPMTTGVGEYAIAFNDIENVITGECAAAFGKGTKARGSYAHAEGYNTKAENLACHAEGIDTSAENNGSHAEGKNTIARGLWSHAEGIDTLAENSGSHAEGGNTIARGLWSHAEGYYTIASGRSQHVQGEWNIDEDVTSSNDRGKYAHIVGNGADSNSRSNAHTLDWDGNAWFAGGIKVGGTGQADATSVNVLTENDMKRIIQQTIAALPVYGGETA